MLWLAGELDESVLVALGEALLSATRGGTRSLTVDLTAVSYLPNAAIGALATAMRRCLAEGQELGLQAPAGGASARVLEIAGVAFVPV